jgi:hypothetical protein
MLNSLRPTKRWLAILARRSVIAGSRARQDPCRHFKGSRTAREGHHEGAHVRRPPSARGSGWHRLLYKPTPKRCSRGCPPRGVPVIMHDACGKTEDGKAKPARAAWRNWSSDCASSPSCPRRSAWTLAATAKRQRTRRPTNRPPRAGALGAHLACRRGDLIYVRRLTPKNALGPRPSTASPARLSIVRHRCRPCTPRLAVPCARRIIIMIHNTCPLAPLSVAMPPRRSRSTR